MPGFWIGVLSGLIVWWSINLFLCILFMGSTFTLDETNILSHMFLIMIAIVLGTLRYWGVF